MPIATTPAEVVAGEAVSGTPEQRWNDMVAIASVMANRAALTGTTINDVITAPNQFNAYNAALPPGASAYVDMAQQALDHVARYGPVTSATFYATPAAVQNLPAGLQTVGQTTGHIYSVDPLNRGIVTAQGTIRPDTTALASQDPLQRAITNPVAAEGLLNGVTSLTSVPAQAVTSEVTPATAIDPAFSPNGMLSGAFPTSSFAPAPAQNSFADLAAAGPMGGPFATVNERMGLPANPATSDFATMAAAGVPGGQFATVNERMGVPSVNSGWQDMATAGPMTAPVNATPTGILGAAPQLSASAVATPVDNASVNERMGLAPSSFDTARFGDVAPASFDAARFAGPTAIDSVMATPQSYVDAPAPAVASQPAMNSFADLASAGPISAPMDVSASMGAMRTPNLAAADRVPMAAALFSPVRDTPAETAIDTVAAPAVAPSQISTPPVNSFSDLAAAGPMAAPVNATATGVLGTTPGLSASLASPVSAVPTGVLGVTPGMAASATVPSISAPVNATATGMLSTTPGLAASASVPSIAAATPVAPQTNLGVSSTGYQGLVAESFPSTPVNVTTTTPPVNVAQDPAVSMPNLDTVSVPDQPTVAAPIDSQTTIPGPSVATPTQQTQQTPQTPTNTGQFPSAPTKTGILGGIVNKGTITGGLLGGAVAGPVGGILGGLIGNQVNKSGGLTGLLGGSQGPTSFNNLGSGMGAVQGVYGSMTPGQQATTNNGGFVTSLGMGKTAYTNPMGVTTMFSPTGQPLSYNGPDLSAPGVAGDPSTAPGQNDPDGTQGGYGGGGGVGGFGSLF